MQYLEITKYVKNNIVYIAPWRENLPHPLLLSRAFRGIKPSPIGNTKALTQTKRKSPRHIPKEDKKQNENQPSYEVR